MALYFTPNQNVGRNGGSFQESDINSARVVTKSYGRYCTVRDHEVCPPTSKPGRYWLQIFRTPDNTE